MLNCDAVGIINVIINSQNHDDPQYSTVDQTLLDQFYLSSKSYYITAMWRAFQDSVILNTSLIAVSALFIAEATYNASNTLHILAIKSLPAC